MNIWKIFSLLILSRSFLLGIDFETIEEFSPDQECVECHHSSIIETMPGCFCAVWKGGPNEGESSEVDNRGIWFSHFDGDNWSNPKEIVNIPNSICWNPILSKMPSGEVVLSYRVGLDPRRIVNFIKRSYDAGLNWSKQEFLPVGVVGFTTQSLESIKK